MGAPRKSIGGAWLRLTLFLALFSAAASVQPDSAWMFKYPGAGQGTYQPLASFVDDTCNVYAVGWKGEWGKDLGLFLVKVDSLGRLAWARSYDSVETVGAAMDTSGNLYIAGGQTGGRVCLLKYRPDGNMDWLATYGGASRHSLALHGIALDDSQNVYVGAVSWSAPCDVVHFLKYRPNGTFAGEVSGALRHHLTMLEDRFHILDNGDVILVANSEHSESRPDGDYDWLMARFSKEGRVLWERIYDEAVDSYERQHWSQVDGDGNIYVTGDVPSSSDGTQAFCTMRADSLGKILWTRKYEFPAGSMVPPRFLLVNSGCVYVVGGEDALILAKYDSLGNQLWVRTYADCEPGYGWDGMDPSTPPRFYSMNADSSGHVYITGDGADAGQFAVLLKYDSLGNVVWARKRYEQEEAFSGAMVNLDRDGALYDIGTYGVRGEGWTGIYVLKYRTR